jgi:hypothetical protein
MDGSAGRRPVGARRSTLGARISTAALAALVLGGCGPTAAPPPEPVEPRVAAPRPVPDEPIAPLPPPAPDERIAGAAFEYEEPPRADDAGAHHFAADGTIRDDRLSCIDVEVVITAVDAGSGPADRRIASILLAAAEQLRSDWETEFASEADCRLADGSPLPRHGDLLQTLAEEPCELPGGPPLRCFTLDQSSFGPGYANVDVDVDQFVLDATDGALLSIDEVLALVGIDHREAEARVGRIGCLLDGEGESCIGRPRLPRGRPTATGLVIEYGKGEAGAGNLGARTLFVPWDLLGLPRT